MHVDIDSPRSDILNFGAIWSNSNTNVQVITQQLDGTDTFYLATSSAEEYALVLNGVLLAFGVINGDKTLKPLCMIGIPSDGTIDTISVQATTTTSVRSRKRSKESGKARSQLLKWLQRKMKRQQISGYSNRIQTKEWSFSR